MAYRLAQSDFVFSNPTLKIKSTQKCHSTDIGNGIDGL